MKKRILLLSLILMNAVGSAYPMEGQPRKKNDQISATSAASVSEQESLERFLNLPPEIFIRVLIQYLQKRFDEEAVDSLKSAWPIVQDLSLACKLFNACCKQVEIAKLLSQALSTKERVSLLYAPANKQIREKRKIGAQAALMMIEALKHAGVDLDQLVFEGDAQNTALMLEASFGKPEMVQALIQSGADINAQDRLRYTALMKAVLSFRLDMIKVLLDAGADTSIKTINNMDVLQLCQAYLQVPHVINDEENYKKLKQIFNMLKTYEQPQKLLMPSEESSNNNMEE